MYHISVDWLILLLVEFLPNQTQDVWLGLRCIENWVDEIESASW